MAENRTASLRMLDGDQKGIATLGRVRPDLGADSVARLLQGFTMLCRREAKNADLTVTAELM